MKDYIVPPRLKGPFEAWAKPKDRLNRWMVMDISSPGTGKEVVADNVRNEGTAHRLAACWNACEGFKTEALEQHGIDGVMFGTKEWLMRIEAQRDQAVARIEWIEQVNTLHRQADILYVVDGYQVTIAWDGHPISPDFHGETVAEAIDKAMARFDLAAPPKWVNGERSVQDPVDLQLAAVEKQRDQLLALLEKARDFIGEQKPKTEKVGNRVHLLDDVAKVIRLIRNMDDAIAAAKAGTA